MMGSMAKLLIFLVFVNYQTHFIQCLPVTPTGPQEPDANLSIDEIIRNAAIEAEQNAANRVASDPSNIDNYVEETLIRPDTVYWDLDMLFTREQWVEMTQESLGRTKRKAIKHNYYRWEKNEIPYEMKRGQFTDRDSNTIWNAMNVWSRHTCLTFRRARPSDYHRIVFQTGSGCSSYVGRIGGDQPITLAPGCRYHGVITHEIGHAVGFQHEHSRTDRDTYVTVVEENIIPRAMFNFRKFSPISMNMFGVPYDYLSVMHYGSHSFSKNGKRTIKTKNVAFSNRIGNKIGLSFLDIKLANLMYNCAGKCDDIICPGEGFLDKNCKCLCPSGNLSDPTRMCFTTPPTTTGTTTVTPPVEPCKDHYWYMCPIWASYGYCTAPHRKIVLARRCKKSCGKCSSADTQLGLSGQPRR